MRRGRRTKASLASAVYEGRLVHLRLEPLRRRFVVPLFLLYLDLDELPRVFGRRWLWSATRPALARFRREDYPGDPATPLAETIRDMVARETGARPRGPVRLLTHLRYFGYGFNPASFFYCFDAAGERLEAVVVHVTNTPWGETHSYVVRGADAGGARIRAVAPKALHVSPFLPMDLEHEFRIARPGERLGIRIVDRRGTTRVFDAALAMRRREISGATLASVLLRYPAMTLRVVAGIYFHALRLRLLGVPYHPHPASDVRASRATGRPSLSGVES